MAQGPNVTVKAVNTIVATQRSRALQYISDNLSDNELNRLLELAKSEKARDMLNNKFQMLKMFI